MLCIKRAWSTKQIENNLSASFANLIFIYSLFYTIDYNQNDIFIIVGQNAHKAAFRSVLGHCCSSTSHCPCSKQSPFNLPQLQVLLYRYMKAFLGSVVFPTSTYYPSGPSSVNQLVFTIPLIRTMNDTAYKSTVSMQQIYTQLSGQRFHLKLFLNSKQQTSFQI